LLLPPKNIFFAACFTECSTASEEVGLRWPAAAFFAIYHPFLSWLPVGLLGITNALPFKKTGNLAPAILLHMVYNAVVLS
jgi:membrane protease YdiL (CAAX protease family)